MYCLASKSTIKIMFNEGHQEDEVKLDDTLGRDVCWNLETKKKKKKTNKKKIVT